MHKLAVVGSRTLDPRAVACAVDHHCGEYLAGIEVEIVSGGAAGADAGGKLFAKEGYLQYTEFPAEWDKYGKSAGFKRNVLIADYADECIAFWDGKSKGTRHTLNLFLDRGKPIRVVIIQ